MAGLGYGSILGPDQDRLAHLAEPDVPFGYLVRVTKRISLVTTQYSEGN